MAKHTGSKLTAGGLSKVEPFYNVFNRIRCRVTDPKNKDYPRYGGRGIKFLWKDYMEFKKDMWSSYKKHKNKNTSTSIERINVNGNYCKENCKWITMKEQAKNKRGSRYIVYKGLTMNIADWARKLKTSRQTLRYRMENGWDTKTIIETPVNYHNKYANIKKIVRTSKKICRK